jgi:cell wall-associated NlpC family hydrolase
VRFRAVPAVLCSILSVVVGLPTAASASSNGGVSAGSGGVSAGSSSGHSSSASAGGAAPTGSPPAKKPYTAPVTSHSGSLAYSGPVYERTAAGQVVPYVSAQASGELKSLTGGAAAGQLVAGKPELLVPGRTARYVNGLAAAPMAAPLAVQKIVWAGNQIVGLPYIWGGGHASFKSPGYDCSGTVSFALHGGHLLSTPEDSSEFESFGSHGVGGWVTIFTNAGHAYMTVAGLRLDTSSADDPSNQQGPRWRPLRPANSGFSVRHPTGY